MTDRELNLAIHQEVEGWKPVCGTAYGWCRYVEGEWQRTDHEPVPDYCTDPAWCVRMMEKHKHDVFFDPSTKLWEATYKSAAYQCRRSEYDPSLTRAVALAVLQLTREVKK